MDNNKGRENRFSLVSLQFTHVMSFSRNTFAVAECCQISGAFISGCLNFALFECVILQQTKEPLPLLANIIWSFVKGQCRSWSRDISWRTWVKLKPLSISFFLFSSCGIHYTTKTIFHLRRRHFLSSIFNWQVVPQGVVTSYGYIIIVFNQENIIYQATGKRVLKRGILVLTK